jgi:hypothetical protein
VYINHANLRVANAWACHTTGPGSQPRAFRLMLQREGADLDECTLLLPREHSRSLALKAEIAAREADKIARKTKRATEARASLLARRKLARTQMEERVSAQKRARAGGGSKQQRGQKKGGREATAGDLAGAPSVGFQPEPEPEPAPPTPLATASPADVEELMKHGRHTDAMKAMRSMLKGRGASLDMARAVARAAAGIGPGGAGAASADGEEDEKARSWLKQPPADWREVRREESKRLQLQEATRGGISWKSLVDTQGGDVPYTATAKVCYDGSVKQKQQRHASGSPRAAGATAGEEDDARDTSLGLTQDLADAAGGLPPSVLEHLSAVW